MATAIIYASSTGNTENAANKISEQLGGIKLIDIANDNVEIISDFDKIIIGTSTWGEGDLQDDWDDQWDDFQNIDFKNKTVALFGLGDQESYCDVFVDAMGRIYQVVSRNGANIVGKWSIEGYFHDGSLAQIDDHFVGLALDEDNQSDLTEERIISWCNQIKNDIL